MDKQKLARMLSISIAVYLLFSFIIPLLSQFGFLSLSFPPSNRIVPLLLTWFVQFARNGGFAYWLYFETNSYIWALFALVFGLPGVILFYVKEKLNV